MTTLLNLPESDLLFTISRFWSCVQRTNTCWEWTRPLKHNGYGRLKCGDREHQAHRVSWMLHFGPIPDLFKVCHKCDNRSCVNPDHLFLGTQQDNCIDAAAKGRTRRGRRHHATRLTEEQVKAIRASSLGNRPTARIYGVSPNAIRLVRKGVNWRYV